jgi:hypothetical protein
LVDIARPSGHIGYKNKNLFVAITTTGTVLVENFIDSHNLPRKREIGMDCWCGTQGGDSFHWVFGNDCNYVWRGDSLLSPKDEMKGKSVRERKEKLMD